MSLYNVTSCCDCDVTLCEWCHCMMLHHVDTDVTLCEWCHCMMLHHVATDVT